MGMTDAKMKITNKELMILFVENDSDLAGMVIHPASYPYIE